MLDLGFIDDILRVAEYLPEKRQTLLFSATYSQSIKDLADELLHQPRRIEVARRNIAADAVKQAIYPVERGRKREMLSHLIRKGDWNQVLVFVRTRYGADKLTDELLFDGIKAAAIHSNKSQSIRTRTLAEFKKGELRVLVATDVAARGLDIERLPHVVNYDLPQVPEDYVHRIGRTGRAGEDGIALSLLCPEEQPLLQAIEKLLKYSVPRQTIAEFPQVAVKRGVKAKTVKTANGPSKAKKRASKTSQPPATVKTASPSKAERSAKPAQARSVKGSAPAPTPTSTKPTTPRRKKVVEERPAPKIGRRGQRSKG
jgi:ATP-dependent RNA helicase RhlE